MEEVKDAKKIDVTAIIKKLWPHRKKYFYVLPATLMGATIGNLLK